MTNIDLNALIDRLLQALEKTDHRLDKIETQRHDERQMLHTLIANMAELQATVRMHLEQFVPRVKELEQKQDDLLERVARIEEQKVATRKDLALVGSGSAGLGAGVVALAKWVFNLIANGGGGT